MHKQNRPWRDNPVAVTGNVVGYFAASTYGDHQLINNYKTCLGMYAIAGLLCLCNALTVNLCRADVDSQATAATTQRSSGNVLIINLGQPSSFSPAGLTNGRLPSALNSSLHQDGLIVCEPQVSNNSPAFADFTAGCGDWLNFSVGGTPELGATPMWYADSRALWEMHRKDMRIDMDDAAKLQQITGIDLVAVGTATGDLDSMRITYTIYRLPSRLHVGDPIVIQGSDAQVADQLSAIADKFKAALLPGSSNVTPAAGLTPSQLELCGRVRWLSTYASPSDQELLQEAAGTSPYASMLTLSRVKVDTLHSFSDYEGKLLLDKVGDNAIALGEVEYVENIDFTVFQPLVDASLKQFPYNFQLNICKMFADHQNLAFADKLDCAKAAVRSAPDNPDALLNLSYAYSEVYNRYRKGRYHSEMTAVETQMANAYLPFWLGYAEAAVKKDPYDAHAWGRVAQAAAYGGYHQEAIGALSEAINLGTSDDKEDAYEFALQICEQRWLDRPDLRDMYVTAVLEDPSVTAGQLLQIIDRLVDARDKAQRTRIVDIAIARAQIRTVDSPDDPAAFEVLGDAYTTRHSRILAAEALGKASALSQKDYFLHFKYATALALAGRIVQAIAEYDAAIRLSPFYPGAYTYRGLCYVDLHDYPSAIASFNAALRQNPRNISAYTGLADADQLTTNYPAAETAARAGLKWQPGNKSCWEILMNVLDAERKFPEFIAMAKVARSYGRLTYDPAILNDLADVYIKTGSPGRSLTICVQCLRFDPTDQCAHENKGEAYIAMGKRAAAKQEWEEVVRSGDKSYVSIAESYLTKYKMTAS